MEDIEVFEVRIRRFVRNKDQEKIISIITENRETALKFNTYHNIVEISYSTELTTYTLNGTPIKLTNSDYFSISYRTLDLIFSKYKDCKQIMTKLIKYCMHSKAKNYWLTIKDKPIGKEIMSIILGESNDY